MDKKIPERTCVVSKEKLPKRDLFRIVRTPSGEVIIDDEKGKSNGRGAYLKKDKDVILKAQKTGILEKHLEVKIPDEIYTELIDKLENA